MVVVSLLDIEDIVMMKSDKSLSSHRTVYYCGDNKMINDILYFHMR